MGLMGISLLNSSLYYIAANDGNLPNVYTKEGQKKLWSNVKEGHLERSKLTKDDAVKKDELRRVTLADDRLKDIDSNYKRDASSYAVETNHLRNKDQSTTVSSGGEIKNNYYLYRYNFLRNDILFKNNGFYHAGLESARALSVDYAPAIYLVGAFNYRYADNAFWDKNSLIHLKTKYDYVSAAVCNFDNMLADQELQQEDKDLIAKVRQEHEELSRILAEKTGNADFLKKKCTVSK